MKLEVLGTGSTGNCYVLKDSKGKMLILDVGLPVLEIKKGLHFDIRNTCGMVVTHAHADHYLAYMALACMGVRNLEPETVKNRNNGIYPKVAKATWGDYKVVGFPITNADGRFVHTNGDGSECPIYGYKIYHPEMGNLLYITDCEYIKYRFSDIDHILLGVNYSQEILKQANDIKTKHVYQGHLALETARGFVENTIPTSNLIMCHLSNDNANADYFITQMEKAVKCPVCVAEKGKSYQLRRYNEAPF